MAIIVVLFNLKAGVDPAVYEQWARSTDSPSVNELPSVNSFRVLKTSGLLSGAAAPYEYVELIDVKDIDGLRKDVSSDTMRAVAKEFQEFADSPLFIVTEPCA